MTQNPGVLMVPNEFTRSTWLRETPQKSAVFPVTEPPKAEIRLGSFVYIMKPMFELQKILGHFPLHINTSGNVADENNRETTVNKLTTNHIRTRIRPNPAVLLIFYYFQLMDDISHICGVMS
jgi:hypothetical protein